MMRIQARWAAHWLRYALRACAVIGLLAAAMVLVPGAAWSQTPDRLDLRPFRARVDDLLFQYGLQHDRLALLLYYTRSGIYLYQHNIHRPMIAASNAKLVTTYAALQVLSPDYRWRTRFYLVEEQNDAQGPARQGLLEPSHRVCARHERLGRIKWQDLWPDWDEDLGIWKRGRRWTSGRTFRPVRGAAAR